MVRTTPGPARLRRKKRLFKRAEGFVGGRRKLLKVVRETVLRAAGFRLPRSSPAKAGIPSLMDPAH